MTKICLIPFVFVTISLLVFSPCSEKVHSLSFKKNEKVELVEKEEFKNTDIPHEEEVMVIHMEQEDYKELSDINPNAISEVITDITNFEVSCIKKITDGYLCGGVVKKSKSAYDTSTERNCCYIPYLVKLDQWGYVIWEKEYDYITNTGEINHLCVLDDETIVLSIQSYFYSRRKDTTCIMKCNKNGDELWHKELNNYNCNSIFAKEEVILLGECQNKRDHKTKYNKVSINDYSITQDIAIIKLDKQGEIIEQKNYGGNDFEKLYEAFYHKDKGFIIKGATQSNDGHFGFAGDINHTIIFTACIDDELNIQWVNHHENDHYDFINGQFLLSNDHIYIVGNDKNNTSSNTPTDCKSIFQKYDMDGNILKEVTYRTLLLYMWDKAFHSLTNDRLIIGYGNGDNGLLIVFDQDGNEIRRIVELEVSPSKIIPTEDGGFIVKAVRNIEKIPTSIYSSRMLFDSEVVVIKYDAQYKVEWRKTYDRYKDSRVDFVQPFSDGTVLIE